MHDAGICSSCSTGRKTDVGPLNVLPSPFAAAGTSSVIERKKRHRLIFNRKMPCRSPEISINSDTVTAPPPFTQKKNREMRCGGRLVRLRWPRPDSSLPQGALASERRSLPCDNSRCRYNIGASDYASMVGEKSMAPFTPPWKIH